MGKMNGDAVVIPSSTPWYIDRCSVLELLHWLSVTPFGSRIQLAFPIDFVAFLCNRFGSGDYFDTSVSELVSFPFRKRRRFQFGSTRFPLCCSRPTLEIIGRGTSRNERRFVLSGREVCEPKQ